ncbi:MAG: hypothetical protein J7623_25685 [Chitinophaga sp.]|uniref:hypothetical protein n=1 Tax=Chitinophaga sp. TaxID=1869181 RepID=UPI001B17B806|nr:hypothetical protein [Chitinophaga sp.]MBO9732059.1 hypothetical protein [Chitinophaga sp.]
MKKHLLFVQLLAVTLSAISCKKNTDHNSNTNIPEKNVVKGKVTDTQGRPLKGVSILIDNTIIYNSYISGTTGDDGTYKVELITGAWQAYASMKVPYNGKTYTIDLHPDNNSGFGGDGAVRNFSWKLTGAKAEPMTGVYGGIILVDKHGIGDIYDTENIEFTLTPVGNLIDGTAGQVIKRSLGASGSDLEHKLYDLPMGRYTVSAVYHGAAGSQPIKLRDRINNTNGAFASSLQLNFEPSTSEGYNMAMIEWEG